ncbi:fimbria/pilus outer membrane usher protein [Undibacterium rugosum]|nr:fimbria/pilus outer membrane usher protein [Undibacterium rugosum]MBR7780221.1 fimbria/pilus outer membrane usher protein [Undibacterium rugosum]
MKKIFCVCSVVFSNVLLANAIDGLQNTEAELPVVSDWLIYMNGNLLGSYSVCQLGGRGEVYLSPSFFGQVRLKSDPKKVICDGESYQKISAHFKVNVPEKHLEIEATPTDFMAATMETNKKEPERKTQPAPVVPAMALQHSLSFWNSLTAGDSLSGALSGQYYSKVGLFSVDGQFSKDSSGFQQNLTDASWRRHFSEYGIDSRFGLNNFWAAGTGLRLYGLSVGSDLNSISNNSGIFIDGFADVPGRLQIRSRGVLLKDMQVGAGYFSVSGATLMNSMGGNGLYTLTLLDINDRVVKNWDVFVPVGAQILRPGAYDWKFFVGDVRNNLSGNAIGLHSDHLSAGLAYRYGVSRQLSVELMGVIGSGTRGGAIAFAYTPVSWLTLNGNTSNFSGTDSPTLSSYLGGSVTKGNLTATLGVTRQLCFMSVVDSGDNCNMLQSSVTYFSEKMGRFNFQSNRQLSGIENSNTGLSWSLPAWRKMNLSFFANQHRSFGSVANSFGLNLSMPFGSGQLSAGAYRSDVTTLTTNYSRAVNNELQYSIGADIQPGNSDSSAVRASASYNPWYGNYIVNANAGSLSQSFGAGESGALIVSQGQMMVSKRSDENYAILHVPELGGVTIENSFGQRVAVANKNGYAAIPVASGNIPVLKVAEEQLPDNIEVKDSTALKFDYWQAAMWKPSVTQVNRGWLKLILANGSDVPLGASIQGKEGEDPLIVLNGGELYFPDLPSATRTLQVSLPGDIARCTVDLPEGLKLNQANTPEKPQFVCKIISN